MRGDAVEGEDDVVPAPAGLDRGADGFAGHVRRLPPAGSRSGPCCATSSTTAARTAASYWARSKTKGPEACVFADRTQVPCEATPGDMVVVDSICASKGSHPTSPQLQPSNHATPGRGPLIQGPPKIVKREVTIVEVLGDEATMINCRVPALARFELCQEIDERTSINKRHNSRRRPRNLSSELQQFHRQYGRHVPIIASRQPLPCSRSASFSVAVQSMATFPRRSRWPATRRIVGLPWLPRSEIRFSRKPV